MYLIYQKLPSFSSYSTSASDRAVVQSGHQLIIRLPWYINPFSYNFTNTSRTAFEQPSSMVKRERSQSQDAPIRLVWSTIRLPNRFFQSQTRSKNFSRPKSYFVSPSSFRRDSSTFICVAIPAWSHPGSHRASYPFILLNLTKTSCSVRFRACPICSCPVTFGGGITMVKGSLSGFTSA